MARGVKKHEWSLLPKGEGSRVVDGRRGTGEESGSQLEQATLKKISHYAFDRPVIYKGFDEEPPVNHKRKKGENNSCLSTEHNNVLLIGRQNIFWFLRKKEK